MQSYTRRESGARCDGCSSGSRAVRLVILLLVTCCVVGVTGRTSRCCKATAPSQTSSDTASLSIYQYEFVGDNQRRYERRDIFGQVDGAYQVTFPQGRGFMTYSYAFPAVRPVSREVGLPRTRSFHNSKQSSALETFNQQLSQPAVLSDGRDEDDGLVKNDAIIVESREDSARGINR